MATVVRLRSSVFRARRAGSEEIELSRMTRRTSPIAVTRHQGGAPAAAAGTMGLAARTGGSSRGGGGSRRAGIRSLYATGDETWNEVVQGVVDAFNERSETAEIQLDPLPSG